MYKNSSVAMVTQINTWSANVYITYPNDSVAMVTPIPITCIANVYCTSIWS